MKSVADGLRDATRLRISALTATERIELALALGARDVELYAATSGLDHEEARRRLRAGGAWAVPPRVAAKTCRDAAAPCRRRRQLAVEARDWRRMANALGRVMKLA